MTCIYSSGKSNVYLLNMHGHLLKPRSYDAVEAPTTRAFHFRVISWRVDFIRVANQWLFTPALASPRCIVPSADALSLRPIQKLNLYIMLFLHFRTAPVQGSFELTGRWFFADPVQKDIRVRSSFFTLHKILSRMKT
jgi:hypothetical protein